MNPKLLTTISPDAAEKKAPPITSADMSVDQSSQMATLAATAAWRLSRWNDLEKYTGTSMSIYVVMATGTPLNLYVIFSRTPFPTSIPVNWGPIVLIQLDPQHDPPHDDDPYIFSSSDQMQLSYQRHFFSALIQINKSNYDAAQELINQSRYKIDIVVTLYKHIHKITNQGIVIMTKLGTIGLMN